MSKRGRGGRGGLSKAVREHLNLSPNEILKEPAIGAPETFPPLLFHPQKNTGERSLGRTYMLMVKKELREYFQNSEYFITLDSKKPDIERYSDRFHCLNSNPQLHLDWSRFPKELCTVSTATSKRKKVKANVKVNVKQARRAQVPDVDIKVKLEELEKKESTGEDVEKKEEEEKEENVVDEEEEEDDFDEEMDEGTDYINTYFDNGENYIDDDGDAYEEGVC